VGFLGGFFWVFLGGFFGFFWAGFLLPTLGTGNKGVQYRNLYYGGNFYLTAFQLRA
jgi:hypothetical protein